MRFLLQLAMNSSNKECSLPVDYQYMQSAVIYKILGSSDEAYASWLHNNGYQLESGKRFKLFCYSRFKFGKYHFNREAQVFRLLDSKVEWTISFLPKRSTQEFVQGLFSGTHFTIGNSSHHINFDVTSLEMLPPLPELKEVTYEATSPVCIKQHIGERVQYISPTDAHYSDGIFQGLLSRYEVLNGKPYDGDLSSLRFELIDGNVKSQLVDIKGIKVRGYRYSFRLTAPPELQQIAYEGGIGEECSQGFGFVERKVK